MQPSKQTIFEYFASFAKERPSDVFLFDEERSYTVSQALEAICSAAAVLAQNGVGEGEAVAVSATRTADTIINIFALQFLGAEAVLYDPRERCGEEKILLSGRTLSVNGREISVDYSKKYTFIPTFKDSAKPTVIIFTSGSTGIPKRVWLSQYNFINNALDTLDIGGYRADDVNADVLPLHHVFGLALIFTAVVARHAIFVPQSVRPEYIVQSIIKYGVTRLNGVPSLYLAMAECEQTQSITTLRCGLIGGAPCTAEQFSYIEKKLGITLIPVYGMSECIGISCSDGRLTAEQRCSNVGRVYSMNKVSFAPDGEILVKSPAMASGSAGEDGWLHTSPMGYLDGDGMLHVSGRKKDIIIRNGNNLSAVAIEQKLLCLPAVKDACVVGVPDGREGEVPAAAIVLSPGSRLESVDLRSVLAKNELPAQVIFLPAIPLTSSGKPDKLRARTLFSPAD